MSRLVVNSLQSRGGADIKLNNKLDYQGNYQPGQIIEYLSGTCDGRTITVLSGSYTLENVTGVLAFTTTYQYIPGSRISYTPPTGTKYVTYNFDFKWRAANYSGISHFKMLVDGVEVIPAYRDFSGEYVSSAHHTRNEHMRYVFQCASDNNAAYGRFPSWASAKTIEIWAREYDGSTYQARINANTWRDGSGASGDYAIAWPTLTITAVA